MSADNEPGDGATRHRARDGAAFEIQPCIDGAHHFTRAQWRAELQRGMTRLSPRSRWQRFASGIGQLSDRQLDELTDIDGTWRVALCAVVATGGDYEGIGVAPYLVLPGTTDIAEFAVTVVDRWQGRGVGGALLDRLLDSARRSGLATLRGYVFPSNAAMLALCRRHGARIVAGTDFIQVDIDVGR